MSYLMKLSDAYNTLKRLAPEKNVSESYYYDILYKVSTAVFENRMANNMNQTEFSELLGVSQAMVSKYESGDYNFTIKQICKLCEMLDLSIDFSLSPISSEKSMVSYKEENTVIPIMDYKFLEEAA